MKRDLTNPAYVDEVVRRYYRRRNAPFVAMRAALLSPMVRFLDWSTPILERAALRQDWRGRIVRLLAR